MNSTPNGRPRALRGSSRLADAIAFEARLPYYAFVARRPQTTPSSFSIDRDIGYKGILFLVMLAVAVEVVVVHLFVRSLGSTVAPWVFTVLGLYGVVWLLADYGAIRHHPILVGERDLTVRVGFRWQARIDFDNIDRIGTARWGSIDDACLNMSAFGAPKLVLRLKQPVVVEGVYGLRRSVRCIGLNVDNQADFVAAVQAKRRNEDGPKSED